MLDDLAKIAEYFELLAANIAMLKERYANDSYAVERLEAAHSAALRGLDLAREQRKWPSNSLFVMSAYEPIADISYVRRWGPRL